MPGKFPAAWVDQVYARADIVQIVSAYLPLKKQGHNHWGLCPFHHEKTASFSVNPDLNVYYCFGCKAGGNVVQFVMEMERLTYQEALLHLANLLRLPPPPTDNSGREEAQRSRRERTYQINAMAAHHFHENLWQPQGEKALAYLKSRGLDDGVIRRFGLGASSEQWDDLLKALRERGASVEELREAGLIHVKETHQYDVFRGRVMYPIIDLFGNVLGFGARALGNEQPKYLNTADTPVFNKRFQIYGGNYLRKLRHLQRVLLVEGYMDVIALSQYGVEGAVATLGTSLTPEQARLMKRFAPEIWIAYDGDEPGQQAAQRALDIFEQEDIPAKVLVFPQGMDPDELLRRRGGPAFAQVQPISGPAFRLNRLEKGNDLATEEGRAQFAKQAAAVVARVKEPVDRDTLLKTLAIKTGFAKDVLIEQMGRRPAGATPAGARHKNLTLTRGKKAADVEVNQAEKTLLNLLAGGYLSPGVVQPEDFDTPLYARIAQQLLDGISPQVILAGLEEAKDRAGAGEVFAAQPAIEREGAMRAVEECLFSVRSARIVRQIDALKQNLQSVAEDQRPSILADIIALNAQLTAGKRALVMGKDVL